MGRGCGQQYRPRVRTEDVGARDEGDEEFLDGVCVAAGDEYAGEGDGGEGDGG